VAACNRRCSFCPASDDYYKNIGLKGILKKDHYAKLLSDLSTVDYSGVILYSGESEPLLHKHILELISLTVQTLPNCTLQINTNGDLLTPKKLQNIFDAGLSRLSISMYDGPDQIDHFQKLIKSTSVEPEKVLLRRRYFENGNYGIVFTNRGGLANTDEFISKDDIATQFPISKSCNYPFYYLVGDVAGNIVMCPHDWTKKYVVGNFLQEHIFDIWTGNRLRVARAKLGNCDRTLPSCEACDAHGELIGETHVNEWQKVSLDTDD
jgi:hypothetical protein